MKLIMLILIVTGSAWSQRIPTDRTNADEGKRLYLANCAKCHNLNPTKPGTIGPELVTTPLEVFRSKVPYGKYPDGYTPKRKTKVMPRFPHLVNQVDFIYSYVRSFVK